jgi:hypothetical protein
MERYGLGGKAILYRNDGEDGDIGFVGATKTQAEAVFRRTDYAELPLRHRRQMLSRSGERRS